MYRLGLPLILLTAGSSPRLTPAPKVTRGDVAIYYQPPVTAEQAAVVADAVVHFYGSERTADGHQVSYYLSRPGGAYQVRCSLASGVEITDAAFRAELASIGAKVVGALGGATVEMLLCDRSGATLDVIAVGKQILPR